MYFDAAIVGGGASGLAAAAFLSRIMFSRREKFNICVIEGGPRLGKKLSATGNGQGNVGNTSISSKNYHSAGPQNFGGGSVRRMKRAEFTLRGGRLRLSPTAL